jgi:phospholipase/carboxylesterase
MTELASVVIEPSAPHSGTVVWLHGLGASGHDFEPVAPMLGRPDLRFVFPHAPQRPVTINGGYVMPAWYDIRSLARTADREDVGHIRAAAGQLGALLDREAAPVGAARVVLLGFSQGAAMALHVGARYGGTLAGIGVLSGYLVMEDSLDAERGEANAATPFFFGHGTRDGVVPVARGRAAHARMTALGNPCGWHEWPIAHEVHLPEIEAIAGWLGEVLPPR